MQWRHADGTIRVDHLDARPGDYFREAPEIAHCPELRYTLPGGAQHWQCDCGYVGTENMMNKHMADQGWCSECWGSGSDPYPSLGLCQECHGTGELVR